MLIKGFENLSSDNRPSVVSIGNYDGVHLGHQHVVSSLLRKSVELNVPSTVITFEPLAKEFFMPDSVSRLTSVEQRAQTLFALGVDQVLCIEFSQSFANYSPTDFVEDVLIDGLGVQYLCVGDDFRFGKDRAGDFEFLRRLGDAKGFVVEAHDTFVVSGERVSSGRVRAALAASNFSLVEKLLGQPYTIQGYVERGQQLGRTLNFPTANIVLGAYRLAVQGVYVVRCRINGQGEWFNGVANIGNRPTVDGSQHRLEVHLFDFSADIYGAQLSVELIAKIRNEQKFDSIDQLREQIERDVRSAKEYCHKN